MNVLELFRSFQTQEQALEYLEKVRWRGAPECPYCLSKHCGRHASADRAMARWQCLDCGRAFSVTIGTIFHGTHVPLRDWFLVLALMLNAKKSASAYQISRDIGRRRPTVWSMMQRIRTAMAADPQQEQLLYGIVEMDEFCMKLTVTHGLASLETPTRHLESYAQACSCPAGQAVSPCA